MERRVTSRKKIQPVYRVINTKRMQRERDSGEEQEKRQNEYEKFQKLVICKKNSLEVLLSEEGIRTNVYTKDGVEVFQICLQLFDCKA